MFIVYDKSIGKLVFSNTSRGFDIVYEVQEGESKNSVDYMLDNENIVYSPDNTIALEYYKRVNSKKTLRELTISYNCITYKANDESTSRMLSNIAVMNDTDTIDWKTLDGSIIAVTKNDLVNIVKAANAERTMLITT